ATGQGVVVAVVDTGYRPHEDLLANILPGYDFISDAGMANDGDGRDNDARDPGDALVRGECGEGFPPEDTNSSWHGTHVAGTIAAVTNNRRGVAGVAYNAKVLPLRVLGKCGGYTTDITDAIYWAAGLSVDGVPDNPNPAQVINLSLGSSTEADCLNTYRNAIDAARAAGAVVVIASGNSSKNANKFPPGNCEAALSVAATNRDGGRAFYSNYGTVIDVAAPGGAKSFENDPNGILSTIETGTDEPEGDGYGFYQGTSMAAPHVAGLAALVFSRGNVSVTDVENIIVNTSRPFPASCEGCGSGIVDASVAVQASGKANLAVEILTDGVAVNEGRVTYDVEVVNNGFASARNVRLVHTLPEGSVLQSASATQGNCDTGSLQCDLGDMSKGKTVTVTVVATITGKDQLFVAEVSGDASEFSMEDNRSEARFGGAAALIVLVSLLLAWRRRLNQF
ncbi:MAG: S8 family serine peptidase, partial [Ketobacteraceae bacterium]|nr:S8 family serine peptidase [Ketobacteraceae bacterium]